MHSGRRFLLGGVLILGAWAACSSPTGPSGAPTPTPTPPPSQIESGAAITSFSIDPPRIFEGESFTLAWKGEGAGVTVQLARKGESPFIVGLPLTGEHVMAAGQTGYPSALGVTIYEAIVGDAASRREATLTMNPAPTPTPTPVPTPTPDTCPGGRRWGGHCYRIAPTSMSWTDGLQWCRNRKWDLAAINSAAENAFIVGYRDDYANNNYLWIGISDIDIEGTFVWSNGDPVTYVNWASYEPDGSDDCGCIFRASATWYENTCTNHYRPICEGR